MILVLAGTTEGRNTAAFLEKEGQRVMATTATAYGGELLRCSFKGEIISRPLTGAELLELIREKRIEKVVDATHPYALEISSNARWACLEAGILYERIERAALPFPDRETVIEAESVEAASELAAAFKGKVFLAIGSGKLHYFCSLIDTVRLVVRVLPLAESLDKCLALGIPPANIICMQGPFDEELNRLLLRRHNASVLVTKESGVAGGTAEKIRAARSLGIPVILINRP